VFSLEMSKESLLLRLLAPKLCGCAQIPHRHMNRDDWGKVTGALTNLADAPLVD